MKLIRKVLSIIVSGLKRIAEKLGYYLIPKHFYSPIPDVEELMRNSSWDSKPKKMVGIDLRNAYQTKLLREIFPRYVHEYDFPIEQQKQNKSVSFYFNNHMFANTDAEVYYCMIRHFNPRIIIEVGGGFSTLICREAVRKNNQDNNQKTAINVIDPFPNNKLSFLASEQSIRLFPQKVESVDTAMFMQLQKDDILFIDSTHVIKSGGDVNYLFLEVLPMLNRGVLIHVHDIRLPYEVLKDDLKIGHYFTEQYILQALLCGNNSFEVLWASYFMSKEYQSEVGRVFRSSFDGRYPGGSWWMRKNII